MGQDTEREQSPRGPATPLERVERGRSALFQRSRVVLTLLKDR
jgi:hypothetical protein